MSTPYSYSLSTYILGGTAAAILATGIIPLGIVSEDQFLLQTPSQAIAKAALSEEVAKTSVDRSRKGDRLTLWRIDPIANTAVIRKSVAAPEVPSDPMRTPTLTPAPAPLLNCEALASPLTDHILGHLSGRCIA